NSYVSLPVSNFPPGPALVTLFVNGIPSPSRILQISPGSSILLQRPTRLPNGGFQFEFFCTAGASYTAVATTNVSAAGNWTVLGPIAEVSPGQFRFTDPAAINQPQRFYRVTSP